MSRPPTYTLGRIDGDEFKPYTQDTVGFCNAASRPLYDTVFDHDRTLVIGRAPPDQPTARVTIDGKSIVAPAAAGRTFLLVFRGKYRPENVRVVSTR